MDTERGRYRDREFRRHITRSADGEICHYILDHVQLSSWWILVLLLATLQAHIRGN